MGRREGGKEEGREGEKRPIKIILSEEVYNSVLTTGAALVVDADGVDCCGPAKLIPSWRNWSTNRISPLVERRGGGGRRGSMSRCVMPETDNTDMHALTSFWSHS